MKELIKGLKVLLLTLFAYLFQACAMQYFAIGGVTASFPFITLAVFVVSLGKKYAFCTSCMIGICTECMLGEVPSLYLLAYPVITMLCAQFFADLTERQREKRINDHRGKGFLSRLRQKEMPALIRIPLCAVLMDLIFHIVMCVYEYLIGTEISFTHISRLVRSVLYTGALTVLLMIPMRAYLGMYRRNKPKKKKKDKDDDLPLPRQNIFFEDDAEYESASGTIPEEAVPEDYGLNDDFDFYPEEGE